MTIETQDESLSQICQGFASKLILEVFGSGGAIWGFSEAIGLRNHSTIHIWRPIAILTSVVFLMRWSIQLSHRLNGIKSRETEKYVDDISGEIDGLTLQDSTYT